MLYKNKERRREHDRERRRRQRAGVAAAAGQGTLKKMSTPMLPAQPSVLDILAILAAQLNEVLACGAEPLVKARCVALLSNAAIRGIEVGDLEKRLAALEAVAKEVNAEHKGVES